jgi:isopenicillin N synthase-like dioxygenase
LTSNYDHAVDLRAGAHSDYGSITLLFQRDGQPGLEILTPSGEWAPVPVRPGPSSITSADGGASNSHSSFPPILVNIADLLSYWTCGLLKSTVHRVVFPPEEQRGENAGKDRYSMAFFCHPVHTAELVPVPSRLVEERRKQVQTEGPSTAEGGKVLTAREHLASRLAATYGGSLDEYQRD